MQKTAMLYKKVTAFNSLGEKSSEIKGGHETIAMMLIIINLIQNSQAVKKMCGTQKGYGERRYEIQGGGQEMAVMVGYW